MSGPYIQEFVKHQIPSCYLALLKKKAANIGFYDFNSNQNIFRLTMEILFFLYRGIQNQHYDYLKQTIQSQLIMDYECLRSYKFVVTPDDKEIIRFFKEDVKYVNVSMIQLLLRIFLIYFQSQFQPQNHAQLDKNIKEISLLYSMIKVQTSIDQNAINLTHFLDTYINIIDKAFPFNYKMINILQSLKKQAQFIGMMEKFVNSIIKSKKVEIQNLFRKGGSSENSFEENQGEKNKENVGNQFNDVQSFRKKKKKLNSECNQTEKDKEETPVKSAKNMIKNTTPKSTKTEEYIRKKLNKSPLKMTPMFKKIKKYKKPLERTLYYGQTKRFIPKKNSETSSIFQRYPTATTIYNENQLFFDKARKTQRKHASSMEDDNIDFFVPQTPRPSTFKKINVLKKANSMDASIRQPINLYKC